ncbi:helix-turn-helix domain-containing protein [Ruminococcus flavefaciens]|uniref:helix-turn-helix domain-containing protein n=1 Tax=Ruminococcus flavefaciens TaxID=1265 RepID=UPI0026ED6966|nr:helix-turn-helix domain-containing protein [Ruminococcus flavefaciens]
MNNRCYTVSDICRLLGISKGIAYQLLHSGELEYFRVGRSIRVTDSAIEKYIKAHSSGKKD